MWPLISFSAAMSLLLCMSSSFAQTPPPEDFAAKRAAIDARAKAAEYERDVKEAQCSQRFVVNSCVRQAKSAYFEAQLKLDKELAVLNKREREFEAKERAAQRRENQLEQAAKTSATPTPAQAPKQQRTAQEAAESKAAFDARQADAKQRRAEQEAKIKRPAPAPKPPAVPRSADAAAMAEAAAKDQAKQKDIAARKAAIDQKRAQTQGAPLPPEPKVDVK